MDDPDVLTGVVADEEPALHPGAAAVAARAGASSARVLARAGLIVTGMFLASRVLGYVRTIVYRRRVPGRRASWTPFFAAFRIPDLLFQLVAAGALSSALIPVVAGLFAKEEDARAWRVVSTVTTLMLSVLLVLAALVLWFAPELVAVITPGFNEAQLAETTELTRIMVLSPLLLAAGAIATSVLNSRERFGAAALAPARLQPGDDLRGHRARAGVRGAGPGLRRRARGARPHRGPGPVAGRGSGRGSGRSWTSATTRRARRCC